MPSCVHFFIFLLFPLSAPCYETTPSCDWCRAGCRLQFAFAYFYWLIEGGAQTGMALKPYWDRELDTNLDGSVD